VAGYDPIKIKGPYLDPLNSQSNYSSALLNLFRFLIQSPEYVDRLKRHYQMFRESVDREHSRSITQETNRIENRGSACVIPSVAVGIFPELHGRLCATLRS
jgi:hypothetical protein